MRFLISTILILASALTAMADDDEDLRHFLSLLSGAKIGDNYEAIKKLVPDLEALHPDAGDDNTEALIKTKAGKIGLRGEFNFAKGHLVSRGFESGELTHSEGHDFLLRCIKILERLYGPSKRRINLPSESDGPKDSIGMSFNWHKNKSLLGLDFRYRRDFATVSWGTQADSTSTKLPGPTLAIDDAVRIAKELVRKDNVSVADSYIDSTRLEQSDRRKVWLVTWLRNEYVNDVPIKGGQTYVYVYMDGTAEISYGE